MIEGKMKTNLHDDENDPAILLKKFWSHFKSTNKSEIYTDSRYEHKVFSIIQ